MNLERAATPSVRTATHHTADVPAVIVPYGGCLMKIHHAISVPASRRRAWCVASSLLVVVLVLAGCGGAATPAPAQSPVPGSDATPASATDRLTILEWSGYELPEFWEPFAQQYPDVEPQFTFFAEDAEAFAKLQGGFETDLVHPCNPWWNLYVAEGMVQPIDTSKLTHWDELDPTMTALGQFDGQQYFVPWDWGYESILVRTDKVQQVPQSWADLANPAYAGHLALWDSGESNHIVAALALGLDPWNTTPEQDEQIKQWLIDIKPNLLTYWVDFSELAQLMASGDVWVASNAWADTYSTLLDEGVAVDYIEPAEGRLGWVCGFGISSQAENTDLAYAYIDAMIAPQSMANFSNEYGYGAANREALPLIDQAVIDLFGLDDPAALERAVFYQPLTAEQRGQITNMWNEVKAAP
jgi:spermidine/putrescine-binding protein